MSSQIKSMATGHKSLELSSEETVEYPCSPCAESGRTRQAVKYCVECQDYYCKSCTDSLHNSLPALRKHKLLDQTDFSSSSGQQNLPSVPTDRCKIHTTKLIDMYCKDHDEVGCTSCMTLDHRTCKEVHSIPDIISSKNTVQPDPVSVKKSIQLSMIEMHQEKEVKESRLEQLKHSKQEAIKCVKDFGKKLKDTLVQLEKASIQQIEAEYISREKLLNDDIQMINGHIDDLNKAFNNLTTTAANKAQRFVNLKSGEKILKQTVPRQSSRTAFKKTDISFLIDSEIEEILQRHQSFGNIEPAQPCYNREVYMRIDVKLEDEDKCCIVDCCFLRGTDELIVIDSYNKRLKRIDTEGTIIDYCDLPAIPRAICPTTDEAVVVFFTDKSFLYANFYSGKILGEPCYVPYICQGADCKGADYNSYVYVCDGNSTVNVYDLSS